MNGFAAPGKAVIWGEYAVLAGAPAMVMAVNRYARAAVRKEGENWHITSRGFRGRANLDARSLLRRPPAEATGVVAVIRAALAAMGDPPLPPGMRIELDTSAFHHQGEKLGIGSSAAVSAAACAALAAELGQPFSESLALATHRHLQGKEGSGLDIAAACTGGLLRFQGGRSLPATWPEGWRHQFFWVGHATRTTRHLARFGAWRTSGATRTLDDLGRAAEKLFDHPHLESLADYVSRLKRMDADARLGIYGEAHRRLDELASRAQVVYKPCGAGGGDIGIALSDDAESLDTLIALATRDAFLTLDLEIAAHGLHRISS